MNAILWLNTVAIKQNPENLVHLSQVIAESFQVSLENANRMHSQIQASKKATLPLYIALGKCLQKCFEAQGGRLAFKDFFMLHYKKEGVPANESFCFSVHTAQKYQLLYKLARLFPNFPHMCVSYSQLSYLPLGALVSAAEYGDYDKAGWASGSSQSVSSNSSH